MDIDKFEKQPCELSPDALLWNRFIEEICFCDFAILTRLQKNAVIAFWYDAEMNSGGHSGFFDCYPNISKYELIHSLNAIGAHTYSENYIEAVHNGKEDDYTKTDHVFFNINPCLTDIIEKYVLTNATEIFKNIK